MLTQADVGPEADTPIPYAPTPTLTQTENLSIKGNYARKKMRKRLFIAFNEIFV